MSSHTWDPALYDGRHSFVTALGSGVLELLAAAPGERVLDVGCGTGDHVAQLRNSGVEAVGVDASVEMIERARAKYPDLPVGVADVTALPYQAEFDAVMSNATLHWVRDAEAAARSIHGALRPRGRFVAELGGAGNVATITTVVDSARAELGVEPAERLWYFPTIGAYASLLESAGFDVGRAWLFDRPTVLSGDDGMGNWLRMFGPHLLAGVQDEDALVGELVERLRPLLHRDGCWWADYRRLRVIATAVP
jgi:trans-aconitate methyltransferase